MRATDDRSLQRLNAEEQQRRRQEDEDLGRSAWALSTRDGSNIRAPTTADLRALGARLRRAVEEGAGMADAAVRAGADTVTFGLADEIAAGADTLLSGAGDLPYDYAAVEQAYLAKRFEQHGTEPGFEWMETEGPGAWDSSQRLHELFDRLSGIKADDRQRQDRLPDVIFDALLKALEDPVFEDIRVLRHKRLAHAADAVSRLQKTAKAGLKMDETAQAHRILLGVLQAISAGLLYGSWRASAIPIAQFNTFEHLAEPLARADQVGRLREAWDGIAAERDQWLNDGYTDLLGLPS